MKIGITFGGYAPLHQGHLDLIMRAKKENDMAFVAVCGYDGEQRTEELKLNLIAKTRLIKDFLEDDTLKVFSVNDTELGLDESFSDENWKIWIGDCLGKIIAYFHSQRKDFNREVEHITWYVGEEKYVKSIMQVFDNNSDFVDVKLADRTENFVSGTECRKHPLKYWSKITQPYRGLMSHNILVTGTASEGKTTLVNDIARYYGLVHSYEKGRDNCDWKKDNEFDAKDFIYNLYEQRRYNEELINSPANTGIFISDTDNMVTLMYAWKYAQRKDFALKEQDYQTLVDIAKIYKRSTHWSKIFLLKPHEKPIVDDGARWMPDSDYQIRLEYFEKLKSLYDEFGYEYEILDGDYYSNFLRIKNYIGDLYE